jgi:hypothetical protein
MQEGSLGIPQLTPEENASLMREIMGGVQWVGEAADKPAAAVRGIAGGVTDIFQGREPDWGGGLLNLIPFGDTMGITDQTERVSGWELGEKWGMPEGKPGFDRWDLAKFGLEVAGDPLFWATGPLGTMTKAGKAAAEAGRAAEMARLAKGPAKTIAGATKELKKATPALGKALEKGIGATPPGGALTPATAIEQIKAGQRALLGLRAPKLRATTFRLPIPHIGMTDEAVASFGTGAWAANAAEKLFYGGGGALSTALWPMRKVIQGYRGTMTPHFRGTFNARGQKAADVGFAETQLLGDAITGMTPTIANLHKQLGERYAEAAQQHLKGNLTGQDAYQDFMRMAAEQMELADGQLPTIQGLQAIARKTLGLKGQQTLPELVANNDEMAKGVLQMLDTLQLSTEIPAYLDLLALGAPGQMLADIYAFHFGRRPSNVNILRESGKDVSKPFFQYSMARQGPLRDLPGGTWMVNRLARDQVYRGIVKDPDAALDLTKATTAKQLKIGQVVHALDRDNYGWVWDVHKNGNKAKVHFVSKEGAEADKWIDESLLVPTTGTPKLPEGKILRKLKPDEHAKLLRNSLKAKGVEVPDEADLTQLRRIWLATQHVRPGLEEAWEAGRGKQFDEWFAGSKVVDEAGRPLKVYHGTFREGFEELDPVGARAYEGPGLPGALYFSARTRLAEEFAGLSSLPHLRDITPEAGSRLYPAYVNIKNPAPSVTLDALKEAGVPIDEWVPRLKAQGYDGYITKDMDEVLVFDKSQIKSAIRNEQMPVVRQRLDGSEVTREEEFARWFKGVEARNQAGKVMKNKDGTIKMLPPRLHEIDDYFSNLPMSTAQTGLFDRTVRRLGRLHALHRGRSIHDALGPQSAFQSRCPKRRRWWNPAGKCLGGRRIHAEGPGDVCRQDGARGRRCRRVARQAATQPRRVPHPKGVRRSSQTAEPQRRSRAGVGQADRLLQGPLDPAVPFLPRPERRFQLLARLDRGAGWIRGAGQRALGLYQVRPRLRQGGRRDATAHQGRYRSRGDHHAQGAGGGNLGPRDARAHDPGLRLNWENWPKTDAFRPRRIHATAWAVEGNTGRTRHGPGLGGLLLGHPPRSTRGTCCPRRHGHARLAPG